MEFGEIDQKTELYLQSIDLKHGLFLFLGERSDGSRVLTRLFANFTYSVMEKE